MGISSKELPGPGGSSEGAFETGRSGMLVVVQFPISDARAFATAPTARLDVPDWPDPRTFGNPQFVRRFGPARERSLGPDAAWTDERIYCNARRAIGLPELRRVRIRAGDVAIQPFCVFRRLFCDRTTAVARVEVGLTAYVPLDEYGLGPLHGIGVESVIRDVLALDTDVFDVTRGSVVRADLIEQGQRLARLYAFATSGRTRASATVQELNLVQFGRPTVMVEFDDDEIDGLPAGARELPDVVRGDAALAFYRQRISSDQVPVWVLRRGTAREPILRSLRLCLLRLHAERECLDRILAHLEARRLGYQAGSDAGDRLTQYLDDATQLLEKQWSHGVQQSQLVEAMNAAETVAPPFGTRALLDRVSGVRRQIRVKVERYAVERSGPRVDVAAGGTFVDNRGGVSAPGGVFNAPVVGSIQADQINDSFNTVINSGAAPEVKDAMEALKAKVDELLPQLPESEARKVASSFKTVAHQSSEPEPVEAIVRAAGEALVDLGKGVQDLAGPIATAVNGVLRALKFVAIVL